MSRGLHLWFCRLHLPPTALVSRLDISLQCSNNMNQFLEAVDIREFKLTANSMQEHTCRNEVFMEVNSKKEIAAAQSRDNVSGRTSSLFHKDNTMDENISQEKTSSERLLLEIPDINEDIQGIQPAVLDWVLGKGQSALLRRVELTTFVNFHGNEAGKGGDLTHDETTIITGALELTEKTAKDAMTLISKAFSLDLDTNLNLETLNAIMAMGHSRVPVYYQNLLNMIGLVLVQLLSVLKVKNLLGVDPDEGVPLRKMTIRKIPRNTRETIEDSLNELRTKTLQLCQSKIILNKLAHELISD